MKILLVDDDSFVRDMYVTKFTEHGDVVTAASSGQDALAKLHDEAFDVVITDMVMPGMTGTELIASAKGVLPEAHYIVLSNQSEESDRSAASAAGAVGYIVKADVVPSEVVTQVHTLISKKK